MLLLTLTDAASGEVTAENFELFAPPFSLAPSIASHTPHINITLGAELSDPSLPIPITLSTDFLAMFLVLTTSAQGRFSDNCFTLLSTNSTTVFFIPWDTNVNQWGALNATLRYEHLGTYHPFN